MTKTPEVVVVEQFDKARDLLNVLQTEDRRWHGRGSWIYRGVSNNTREYRLIPSAFRAPGFKPYDVQDFTNPRLNAWQMTLETNLVENFMKMADYLGQPVPNSHTIHERSISDILKMEHMPNWDTHRNCWPPRRWWHWYALAQHYGVPTRFLDWTWNEYIAAYFAARGACFRDDTEPAGFKYIDIWALNAKAIKRLHIPETPKVHVVTVSTRHNPFLAAQRGVFTLVCHNSEQFHPNRPVVAAVVDDTVKEIVDIHAEHAEKMHRTKLEILEREGLFPLMYRLQLPREEAPTLLRLLASLEIHAGTVTPGLQGVEQLMREHKVYKALTGS